MVNVQALRDKRFKLWEDAKTFLDEHTDADGKISDEDVATYERMEKEIVALGAQIERFEKQANMDAKFNQLHAEYTPISNYSGFFSQKGGTMKKQNTMYQTTGDYHKHFLAAVRQNFKVADEYLREGVDTKGGYLLPTEMNNEIVTKLEQENVMRQICRVIQTESRHKIPIQATKPVATWIREGDPITLSNETFSEIILDANKLACGIKVSNELLADSFYNVEEHLEIEFSKAMAASEEQSFISGSGNGEPDKLLGFPVYTSAFMPQFAKGAVIAAFGDFQRYYIADRAVRTFKPLHELYALNDISAFLMIERVDGKLADNSAIKLLTLK